MDVKRRTLLDNVASWWYNHIRKLIQGIKKMKEVNSFKRGVIDGLPICLGYISVAFAFGISAVERGFSILEALLISMTNVTSAGQVAALPIIAGGGTLIELAVCQLVINLRYALMSVSLSQKAGKSIRLIDRFIISFVNTDEVFAVSSAKEGSVGRKYMYGLILTPFLGWSLGTLLGACAGDILPDYIISALSIAIYGMFIAIVVPVAKREHQTALCVLTAIALSCLFEFVPVLSSVPDGFTVIICSVAASSLFAVIAPLEEDSYA